MIFYLGAREGFCVLAQGGSLKITGGCRTLRGLLEIYNRLFAERNRRFLREDTLRERLEQKVFLLEYNEEKKAKPLRPFFHLPLQNKRISSIKEGNEGKTMSQRRVNFQNKRHKEDASLIRKTRSGTV